jgi:hypothetical protein
MTTFYDEITVTPANQDTGAGKSGGSGGGSGRLPGSSYYGGGGGSGGGGGGGAGGAKKPGSGGSLPIWEWLKSGGEKVGGAMGGVGMGMDAYNMMAAPQQRAMEEAKAGSMAGYQKNQSTAWQSPEYMAWAQKLWGGA